MQSPDGGQRAEPTENFDKNESFCSIFQRSRGRTMVGLELPENLDKNDSFWSIFLQSRGMGLAGYPVQGAEP